MREREIHMGEIYEVGSLETVGSEQKGSRPVLVVQNDELNLMSPTVIVLFITSRLDKRGKKAHVKLPSIEGLPKRSMVLTEQIRTIDKRRLLDKRGELDSKTMAKVLRGLKYTLGMFVNSSSGNNPRRIPKEIREEELPLMMRLMARDAGNKDGP